MTVDRGRRVVFEMLLAAVLAAIIYFVLWAFGHSEPWVAAVAAGVGSFGSMTISRFVRV